MTRSNENGERKGGEPISTPLLEIRKALRLAKEGKPYFGEEGSEGFRSKLLTSLHLDGPDPDGVTLMNRLTASEDPTKREAATLSRIDREVYELIYNASKDRTNEMQERLGRDLAAVAERQSVREGDIYDISTNFVLQAPDRFLSDPSIKEQL